jgi:glutamyl-tRNA reductase
MDHNSSTVEDRADFAARIVPLAGVMKSRGLINEYLRIETCNRAELYLVFSDAEGDRETADAFSEAGSRTLFDYEAVRHLLRVLLGLESLARGESHIVSQVKSAYDSADDCGRVLHRLFQRAVGMAASIRTRYHPGREPSIPYLAASHYVKNSGGAGKKPVIVVGFGVVGRETAHILLLLGMRVLITNRSPREPEEKLSGAEFVPWHVWENHAVSCGAVFLCTSADTPILSASSEDAMPDTWVFDLGSPHQSEKRNAGVRVTLDEMREISRGEMDEYGKSLAVLEDEADRSSGALLAEISILTDDTWKQLALARAHALIEQKASQYAKKIGTDRDELVMFASSVMRAFLHPLVSASAAHGFRAWRILSGEETGGSEE